MMIPENPTLYSFLRLHLGCCRRVRQATISQQEQRNIVVETVIDFIERRVAAKIDGLKAA